jgi:hypothetical protein
MLGSRRIVWTRNLFFFGLCGVGLAGLCASLAPLDRPAARREVRSVETPADLAATVRQVDAAFRDQWSKGSLSSAPRADDLTIARRLSLALTGTIPSVEELRLLEAEPAETRLNWWLEGLLADRRSQDYLAERLARALVGVQDGPFVIYRRRRFVAWLADELRENRPYDQIARQILATTGLWTDHPATNFVTVTIKEDQEKKPDAKELAGRTARAMLGIRMDCAECHDHPFAKWKQSDFQSLAAFFGQTSQTFRGIQDDTSGQFQVENRLTGELETIAPAVPFQAELLPNEGTLRERLAVWVTHPANKAFSRAAVNRTWAILFGRPLVEPIDGLNSDSAVPPAIDLLADDFVRHGYDLRRLIRAIALTEAFCSDSRADADQPSLEIGPAHDAAWAVFPITRLRPEQVVGSLLQSASLTTIDYQSHIVVRLVKAGTQNDFIQRYGDAGEDEFAQRGGTIPQRLLMMNGKQVFEKTKEDLIFNAATQIAVLAPTDEKAVETAYLAVLTRRPTPAELGHFVAELAGSTNRRRGKSVGGDSDRRPAASDEDNRRSELPPTAEVADRQVDNNDATDTEQADTRNRNQRLEDLYWTLLNSTEFSWNH